MWEEGIEGWTVFLLMEPIGTGQSYMAASQSK
jgi:hypothetical protein